MFDAVLSVSGFGGIGTESVITSVENRRGGFLRKPALLLTETALFYCGCFSGIPNSLHRFAYLSRSCSLTSLVGSSSV